MANLDYVFAHVERVVAALRGDDKAIDTMDISAEGFWRSFSAIFYSLPALFFTWVLSARSASYLPAERAMWLRVIYNGAFDIIVWLSLIAAMVLLLGKIGYTKRITQFVVARNWTTLLFNYVIAIAMIPSMFTAQAGAGSFLILLAIVAVIWAFIRITRQALQCGIGLAFALVFTELFAVTAIGIFFSA